jgi:hypothetical protein
MTQQEQQRGPAGETVYVPGPREGEHDDNVAVGTATAPDRQEPGHGGPAESYPAGTYASGSADPGATDRDDVAVVDRDEALADERAEDRDEDRDVEDNRDEPGDFEENRAEGRDDERAEADDEREDEIEDEHDEEAVAEAEEAEDERWETEHADETDEPAEAATDEPAEATDEAAAPEPAAAAAAAAGALWEDDAVDGLRERWRALQLRFIDDPRAVAGEADQLVGEAVASVTGALEAQRRELAAWQGETGDDTERLRTAVRGYRDFLDRLLGL